MIQEGIRLAVERKDLSAQVAREIMNEMMTGVATQSQMASFVTAMRMKGETENELRGFVTAMREHAERISAPDGAIDLCGTGGDSVNTFNISTVSSFVVAAAGVPVAKHGNRAVSSESGSADVLGALGIPFDLDPPAVEQCLRKAGIGFMFAPIFHRSMKNVLSTRREIGIRTYFNILGPMVNPAGVKNQLIGVYDPALAPVIARVLRDLGTCRAMVVNGQGMDEITNVGKTKVVELIEREIREYDISPGTFGLDPADPGAIKGGSATENARTALSILKGEESPRTDIVAMNSAAALYLAGKVSDLQAGFEMAMRTIRSGMAMAKLREFSALTRKMEADRQMTHDISMLRGRRITPEVLARRCSDLSSDLVEQISKLDGGELDLQNLDANLLSRPSILSVLALTRLRRILVERSVQERQVSRAATSLSEAISSSPTVSVIGEYKPTAPSAPPLYVPPDPDDVARAYSSTGIAAVSVLVESDYFGGGPALFSMFRGQLSLPMLFKDFVVTEKQVELAGRLGADAVLLVAKALKREAMEHLVESCCARGMEPLVELHDIADLRKLSSCACSESVRLVGLNSRDLRTMEVNLGRLRELRRMVSSDKLVVAESGIRSPEDVRSLHGFDAVLVGSAFMQADGLERTVDGFVSTARSVAR
jgi:anthranilate phosphoribosyltransferase